MTTILIIDDDKELTDLLEEFLQKFKYTLKCYIIYCYNCGIITLIFIKKIFSRN